MKFLFLSGHAHLALDPFAQQASGGAELQVALLSLELVSRGHDVIIFASRYWSARRHRSQGRENSPPRADSTPDELSTLCVLCRGSCRFFAVKSRTMLSSTVGLPGSMCFKNCALWCLSGWLLFVLWTPKLMADFVARNLCEVCSSSGACDFQIVALPSPTTRRAFSIKRACPAR